MRTRAVVSAAVVAALVALHLFLSRSMDGFLLADGTGYLANARWLVGKAGTTWQGPAAFYNAGWSIVVAPIYLFTRSPGAVYDAVLLVNAVLASASFVAYAALAEIAFGLRRSLAVLAGLVAATYPAVLLQASFEWSESLFHLLFPLLLLAVWRLLRTGGVGIAVVTGVAASALYATHPKGLGVVAAMVLGLAVLAWRGDVPRHAAGAGLAALALAFLATRTLHGALQDALYADTAAAIEGDVVGRITDPALLWGSFQRLWGQLWYLTVASVGLFPLGVAHAVRHRDRRFAGVFLGTALAMLAASCLQMSDGTRVDHMVYGRYDEGFLPSFLVAGAAAVVLAARDRHLWRTAALGGGLFVVLGGLTLVFNGTDRFTGDVMPLNVVGVLVYRFDVDRIHVLAVSALALVPLAVVTGATAYAARLGLAVLVAFFVASSAWVEVRTLRPWEDYWSSITEIPEVVRAIGERGPIGYDLASHDVDAADLYQLELTDTAGLLFFDGAHGHLPDVDLVIASPQWEQPGARLVFAESGIFEQALWALPGELQDDLARRGYLVPEQYSAPLPERAQRAELSVEERSITMRPGGTRAITVHVENRGAAWLPVGPVPVVVQGTVRLGARWHRGGEEVVSQTADLPRMLLPGDDADVRVRLEAPDEPGTYRVVLSLRQESVAWWDASAIELDVLVRD